MNVTLSTIKKQIKEPMLTMKRAEETLSRVNRIKKFVCEKTGSMHKIGIMISNKLSRFLYY